MEKDYKKIIRFTDLIAWQEGHKLVLMIYELTKSFPDDEKYGLINQMRRAIVSVTSCIAEGFSRQSSKEKVQFFKMAQGSLIEIQNQLLIARDVKYLTQEDFLKAADQSVIVHKLLNGLIKATRIKSYEN